jgi:hypothetical protein
MNTAVASPPPAAAGLSQLDQLKQFTVVVADTGDFDAFKQYAPRDATTNPSLILKAAQMPEYSWLMDKAIADLKQSNAGAAELPHRIVDDLLVRFGVEILKIVPGRVSTETDANLSFDTGALVAKAKKFIELYGGALSTNLTALFLSPRRKNSSSFTGRTASGANASSSKSPRLGRASARRKFWSARASTAI